jgi:hypothetical protein
MQHGRRDETRGEKNIRWIETYCRVPNGPYKGRGAKLTQSEREAVLRIYDNIDGPTFDKVQLTRALESYITLLHVCGYEGKLSEFRPDLHPDLFTVWNATGPDLKAALKRKGESIVCPGLGTSYTAAA